jgi:hypothetical protein
MGVVFVPDDAAIECQLLQDIINLTMNTEVPADASLAAQLLKEIRDGLAYVPFKIELDSDQIKLGGDYQIEQCGELPEGKAWEVITACAKIFNNNIPFNGNAVVSILTQGIGKQQFHDNGSILAANEPFFIKMSVINVLDGLGDNIKEESPLIVNIDNSSTVGNGNLIIYGLARKITI